MFLFFIFFTNKILSACAIVSETTNDPSTGLIPPTQFVKIVAASIVDSFELGKASRAFVTAMKYKDTLRDGLVYTCKKLELQRAEQVFFLALNQVFSSEVTDSVTDSVVDLILESAQCGYAYAKDIVKVVSGGKASADIDKGYSKLKMTIKQRLQGFIDDSYYDNEIRQLKLYS